MQLWSYLQIEVSKVHGISDPVFYVHSTDGEHLKDEEFKALDAKGKPVEVEFTRTIEKKWGDITYEKTKRRCWQCGIRRDDLLLAVLNKLGREGWEVVGNIESGQYYDILLLLKRPVLVSDM